jgi:hypothetical protein
MTNIWKKHLLTTTALANPYHETAFQALGITRDVVSRAEISQKLEERRQAIEHKPGFYTLAERELTRFDVNNARQILFDPTRRILEELLEHKPERLEVGEIERIQARLTMPDPPDGQDEAASSRRRAFLLRAVQEFARQYLENLPPVDVPPFPVDVAPIPPFGSPPEAEDGFEENEDDRSAS